MAVSFLRPSCDSGRVDVGSGTVPARCTGSDARSFVDHMAQAWLSGAVAAFAMEFEDRIRWRRSRMRARFLPVACTQAEIQDMSSIVRADGSVIEVAPECCPAGHELAPGRTLV